MGNAIHTEPDQSDHESFSLISFIYTEAEIPTLTVKPIIIVPGTPIADCRTSGTAELSPTENIQSLESFGLHRAFQPRIYVGLEMSLPDFAK